MSKKMMIKPSYLLMGIFAFLFLIGFASATNYNWSFSTASDYIYNASQIIVSGGNAYLNGSSSSPYAWLHLNENTGINVGDSSGNGYNGTIIANASWITGKLNSGLQLNGASQYVNFSSPIGNFERTEAHSFEFWVKTSVTPSSYGVILGKYDASVVRGYMVYIDNLPALDFLLATSGTSYLQVRMTGTIADGNWKHIVVTYDGGSSSSGVKMYLNGISQNFSAVKDNLAGTSLVSENLKLGRDSSGNYFSGSLDEVVIYNKVLSSTEVSQRYNSGAGTESPLGSYQTGNYTIQPKNNFSFSSSLSNFVETATKTGSEIRYCLTSDGTWKYWNGSAWVSSDRSWSQSNSASDVNAHISSLAGSGNFSFTALLHSTDGTYTPYLDNIQVSECAENWVVNYTSCSILDNRTKYYADTNNCGSSSSLPADNGTIVACDYCTPNWVCSLFDNVCGNNPFPILNCLSANDTRNPTCCSQTGLSSDCSADLGSYSQLCGSLKQIVSVPSYPYVDLGVSYPIIYTIEINNVSTNVGIVNINITQPDGNISSFDFVFNNITKKYYLTLNFSEEGDYPFIIYTHYPYISEFTGTFLVRQPFNVTFCGYKRDKSFFNFFFPSDEVTYSYYKNDRAFVTAEFTSSKKHYDTTLEKYITPLGFAQLFKTPVFHTSYDNGCGSLKLYEKDESYAVRLFDGAVSFESTFSPPNITKTYGTNIFLGTYMLNGTDTSYEVILNSQDIHPYTWLLNVILVISLIVTIFVALALFFMLPEYPLISLMFGVGFTILFIVLRIVIFVWQWF